MTDFLEIADERRTSTRGSNSQTRKGVLGVHNGAGQFLPIVWDNLDYIDCGVPHTHPIIISYDDQDAYTYPVGHCTYTSDKYVYFDDQGEEVRELPEWFGAGFYKAYVDRNIFVNFDDAALGTRNTTEVQVGLSYVEANDKIE